MGYALEGWSDASGQPKRRRLARLPRSRGGALIVCLDTSHSMAGGRERLAKAVVLEVVRAAHSHGRPCLLFAFSGSSDLAQLRLTPPRRRRRRATKSARAGAGFTDRRSLTRLLDFLACSFGGGTDVAGPLRRALDVLEHPDEDDVMYAGADMRTPHGASRPRTALAFVRTRRATTRTRCITFYALWRPAAPITAHAICGSPLKRTLARQSRRSPARTTVSRFIRRHGPALPAGATAPKRAEHRAHRPHNSTAHRTRSREIRT